MDSHFDLGLNSPPNERILIRNVLHCAPLVTNGNMFTTNDSLVAFDYGPAVGIDQHQNFSLKEHTYITGDFRRQYINISSGVPVLGEADYRLT